MTLPPWCFVCGSILKPWDDSEPTPCRKCGAVTEPLENLNLKDRNRAEKMMRIERAKDVEVEGDRL
jgi:hypothetical protein